MKTVEQVKKFLADKIVEKGLSYNNLSLQIGKNQTYLQQFVTRESPKRLGEFERKALANILEVSEQDLSDKPITVLNTDIVHIDVLDVRACCGDGIENFTENVIGQQMMTLPALREFTSQAPENIKIIKAIGESMMPTIHTDDVVWVDISVNAPTSDGLYILCIGSDLLIRRIQINPFDNTAMIRADNSQYAPIPHNNYRDIKVIGKVIYHMRKTA